MNQDEVTNKILNMVNNGDITAEEGLRLINTVSSSEAVDEENDIEDENYGSEDEVSGITTNNSMGDVEIIQTTESPFDQERINKFKKWWFLPFSVGLILTVISSIWMYLGITSKGLGWGFWLSWIPFIIGIVIMAISALSSKSKWIHIRVREKGKGKHVNIRFSMPMPLGAAKWFIRNFSHKLKKTKELPLDEIITEIEQGITSDSPLYVKVNDDGDEVEIYIG